MARRVRNLKHPASLQASELMVVVRTLMGIVLMHLVLKGWVSMAVLHTVLVELPGRG